MQTSNKPGENSAPWLDPILERARRRQLSMTDLIQAAERLAGGDVARLRTELYKNWIAFNADHPFVHLAYFNYSVVLRDFGDLAGAINALRECVRIDPNFGPARINLGRALEDGGDIALAVAQWREFAETFPDATVLTFASTSSLEPISRSCLRSSHAVVVARQAMAIKARILGLIEFLQGRRR